jgi:hypothetical protein
MKASTLIQRALQNQMNSQVKITALEKRIQELEAQLEALTVPKQETPPPEMTEAEMEEWAKKAADAITHITVYGCCSKCNRSIAYDHPCGQWKYKVTCGKCGHSEEKSMF